MLDVVLPRGHPLVIDDVGQSYRWLARRAAGGARGARRRAARVTPREAAALPVGRACRGPARLLRGHRLVRARDARRAASSSGSRSAAAAARRCCRPAPYVAAPRLDVAAWLGLPRDQEERLRERLARIATLDEVAPGFADDPPPAGGLIP